MKPFRLLAGAALAAVLASPAFAQSVPAAEPGRLPAVAVPTHYDVAVTPDATALTLKGRVSVDFEVKAPTTTLVLNAADLAIDKASLDGGKDAPKVSLDADEETVTFTFKTPIQPGKHRLTVDYRGKIYRQAAGLFALDYDTAKGSKRALFTQFENSDARRFMPSWDEPGRKATFTLSVTAPVGQEVISNMPAAKTTQLGHGLQQVVFKESPKMSSYLLFLGVGDFERRTATTDGVEIGVVTKRGVLDQGELALNSAGPLLNYYNDYFGKPYPLPKMDLLAAPGGSQFFSAMENWGAIFYFERALLVDPKVTTEAERQRVYTTVAHEMAHQWFGDLVTMQWWDDLWLNEGFADWMESKATQHFHPEWKPEVQAVGSRETAMGLDAKATSHPVVQHITNVAQASQAFDGITYNKGEAVIRMIEGYVGDEAWRTAVRAYMQKHAYGNTVSQDLWAEVEKAAHQPIQDVARDFTMQTGVPMIRVVSARCEGDHTVVTLRQERFGLDDASKKPTVWRVPVTARTLGGSAAARAVISGPNDSTLSVPGCGPLVMNAGQTGYYRTLYAPEAMASLSARFGEAAAADQLGVLSDAWALGQAGYTPMGDYLTLTRKLPVDADPLVWRQVSDAFATLDGLHDAGAARDAWRAYVRASLSPVLNQIGWDAKPQEQANVALLRESLIVTLARAQDPAVLAEARRRFDAYLKDPSSLSAGLRKPVLRAVARSADAETWDKLRSLAKGSLNALEKQDLYQMLGDAEDPALATKALEIALTDEPGATNGPALIRRVAAVHPELAFEFVLGHLDAVGARIEASSRTRFIPSVAEPSSDPAVADKLMAVAGKLFPADEQAAAKTSAAAIRVRAEVKRERLPEVDRWVNANSPKG